MAGGNVIRKDIPVALYYQLKEEIRRKILANEWAEGSRIPSEAEIARMFDVSNITVRKAIDELQNENYLVKKRGRGTFVLNRSIGQKLHKFYSFSEELTTMGIKETAKLIVFQEIIPEASIREPLQIGTEEKVFWIKRIRYMDNKVYAIEHSYIPVKFAPELTGEMVDKNGLYRTLRMFRVFPERAIETFSAVNISREDAKDMNVMVNDAAINLTRVTYSGADVIEYCQSIVNGEVFHYTVELK